MKRTLTITATALLTTATLVAPANAWTSSPQLTREQAIRQTELCAGNPYAGLCTDKRRTETARRAVFAYSADNKDAAAICSTHRLLTHAWRMGFCHDHIYWTATSGARAHSESTLGVIDRAALLHGFVPGQFS